MNQSKYQWVIDAAKRDREMAKLRVIEDEQRRQFRLARREFPDDEEHAARVATKRATEVLAARELERKQQAMLEAAGGEA